MCPVCKHSRCLLECPLYDGESISRGTPIAKCEECGIFIYENDIYYESKSFTWCAVCGDTQSETEE